MLSFKIQLVPITSADTLAVTFLDLVLPAQAAFGKSATLTCVKTYVYYDFRMCEKITAGQQPSFRGLSGIL